MADNRSLDEFLGAGEANDESSERAASEARAVDAEAAAAAPEDGESGEATPSEAVPADVTAAADDGPAAVEPAAETFAWSSTGGPCARCGETVEERWRDDGELVCPDCKVW